MPPSVWIPMEIPCLSCVVAAHEIKDSFIDKVREMPVFAQKVDACK